MFKSLRQNINIKRTVNKQKKSKSPKNVSITKPIKGQNSYKYLNRKKLNGSSCNDYQLICICDHLYQGQFQDNQKHGQGVMILNNGVTVVGSWFKGYLDGNCLFFTPFGGKIYTRFIKGKLEGWCFVCYKGNVEITFFDRDKKSNLRTRFDESEGLWVQSQYNEDGKLIQIVEIESGIRDQLPCFINKKIQLNMLYNKVIVRKEQFFYQKPMRKVKHLNINQFQIYGYICDENPEGLAIIHSDSQIFAGNFVSGSLHKYGMLLFQNGLLYKGQINQGKIQGNGVIYDPILDQTKYITTTSSGFQTILSEQDGFDITQVSFEVGKIIKDAQFNIDRGFEDGIQEICEQISKYYYKTHSVEQSLDNRCLNQSLTSNQDSLNSSQIQQSQEQHNKKYLYTSKPNKSALNQFIGQNFEMSREQEQIQHVSNPKSILGMPLKKAPKFYQIAKRQPNSKTYYPHLQQFQRATKIKYPHQAYEKPGMIYQQRPLKIKVKEQQQIYSKIQ